MPTKRSRSTPKSQPPGPPTGKLILSGLEAYGYHGHNPAERQLGQHFSADIEVVVDTRRAAQSDDLEDTVSYPIVARLAREILEGEPVNLLETAAERIADAILEQPKVVQVTVRVTKRPPVAHLRAFTVEITRPIGTPESRR